MEEQSHKKQPSAEDLSPLPLAEREIKEAWKNFDTDLAKRKSTFLGFQANQGLHYKEVLGQYLDCQINNLGDPYEDGSFRINSKKIERVVLDYYAQLWHGTPYNKRKPKSCWGYVCSMGSTEANLYGLWNGRDYLSGQPLLNPTRKQEVRHKRVVPPTPLLFYSQDTHYSIVKAARLLGLTTFFAIGNRKYRGQCKLTWCDKCRVKRQDRKEREDQEQCEVRGCGMWPTTGVPSEGGLDGTGSIDVHKLAYLVKFFAAKGYPILVNFNYGTAFKGAYDNIGAAETELMPIFEAHGLDKRRVRYEIDGKQYTDSRTGFWFHVDGALGAAYMPFIAKAYEKGLYDGSVPFPKFDFELRSVHSISMSGHKWLGAPWPCAIYMTKRKYQLKPPSDPAYVGTPDSTLAGSRNGLSALILGHYLASTSELAEVLKAMKTQHIADYAYRRLKQLEKELIARGKLDEQGLSVGRASFSLSVYFKKVKKDIVERYSLNEEKFKIKVAGGEQEAAYNHIFAMEHVDEKLIEKLVEDLSKAFETQDGISVSTNARPGGNRHLPADVV